MTTASQYFYWLKLTLDASVRAAASMEQRRHFAAALARLEASEQAYYEATSSRPNG